MKIVQVCAYAAPYEGNFIKSLKELEYVVRKDGYDTIYCFPETAKGLSWCIDLAKNHIVYFLPLARARIKFKTYVLLKLLFKKYPDIRIIHSHFELYDVPVSLVAPSHVKVFWHLHDAIGSYLHGVKKYIWKMHYSFFVKRVILLSVSEMHKQVVISLGFPKEQAYYIPNAIDITRINQVCKYRNCEFDYIILGWDYFRKGVDLAQKSLIELRNNSSLGIIGGKEDEIVNLKDSSYSYSIINTSNDINSIYAKGKCFLHISRAEGLSYALLEALYAGLPVIVSDIAENGFAKIFPTAYFVKNEDIVSIFKVMSVLSRNEFRIDESDINKTRSLIEEKYSLRTWANNIYDYYIYL